jgi:hypothetical protein
MSYQSNLQFKISNLPAGKIVDVSAGYHKTMNFPTVMRKKFGVISSDLGKIFGLQPIPIVSNNLEMYQKALLEYDVTNVQAYLNAWNDLATEGNIRLNQVNANTGRELQLAQTSTSRPLSPRESKELETLRTARKPVYFPTSVVQNQLSPREINKLQTLSTKTSLSPREAKEYEHLIEKRRADTYQARDIIGQNIAKEMAEGRSQKQAISIALSEARRAGLDIPYPNSPRTISQSSKLPYPVY